MPIDTNILSQTYAGDNSTIEITANKVIKVKDNGIGNQQLQSSVLTGRVEKIQSSIATSFFDSNSTTFADVTNPAPITFTGLNPSHTYTIFAIANFQGVFVDATVSYRLVINNTNCPPNKTAVSTVINIIGVVENITGVSSSTVKLQLCTEGPTTRINYDASENNRGTKAQIIAFLIRTA